MNTFSFDEIRDCLSDFPVAAESFGELVPDNKPFAQTVEWGENFHADFYVIDYVDGSSDFEWNTDLNILPSTFVQRVFDRRKEVGKTTKTFSGTCLLFHTESTSQRVLLAKFMNAPLGSPSETQFLQQFKKAGGMMTHVLHDASRSVQLVQRFNRATRRAQKKSKRN